MSGRLEGKVALITGTAGGQGRAAAELFAREGARVAGCDVKVDEAEETVEMVTAAGGEMVSRQPVDLADGEQVDEWISFAVKEFGGFDILYNNASAPKFNHISEMTWDEWSFTIRNELDLIYWACHLAWPHLVERGGGAIVNTASTAGLIGFPTLGDFAHAATKGGVIALTRQLASEGAEVGIRANSISPGFVLSPATAPMMDDPEFAESMKQILDAHMIKRPGQPEDIAYAALYLASDEASWVTGANFVIDGGLTAQ